MAATRIIPTAAPPPSRRRFVLYAVIAGGGALGLASRPAVAGPAKLAPSEVGYQSRPKGRLRCDLCVNWRPPADCVVVNGPINPSGWCGLFVHKP